MNGSSQFQEVGRSCTSQIGKLCFKYPVPGISSGAIGVEAHSDYIKSHFKRFPGTNFITKYREICIHLLLTIISISLYLYELCLLQLHAIVIVQVITSLKIWHVMIKTATAGFLAEKLTLLIVMESTQLEGLKLKVFWCVRV